jgi:deoxyribonuclease V
MSKLSPFPETPDLPRHALHWVRAIPRGKVTTYSAIAEALGHSAAARWVGFFLLHHPHSDACRCHRVVRADGRLGRYIEGENSIKREKLESEGVAFRNDRIDLEISLWIPPARRGPLRELAEYQELLSHRVRFTPRRRLPRNVGAVDVSYPDSGTARAAYALVDATNGKLLWTTTVQRPVMFPYISGFLSFREIPVYLDLLRKVEQQREWAEVLLIDGSGVLHPRGGGIASHLGVTLDRPTIGVTKRLLCGRVDPRPVDREPPRFDNEEFLDVRKEEKTKKGVAAGWPIRKEERIVGMALAPSADGKKRLFVSPGHRLDVEFAAQVVLSCLWGHFLPEPIYWADRISRNPSNAP